MAKVRDVKVKARINMLITELVDKYPDRSRSGRDGTQERKIVDIPEVAMPYEELVQRAADIAEIILHGHQLAELSPPEVWTEDAEVTSPTEATLNGRVLSQEVNTVTTFNYGTTPELGTSVTADESPINDAEVETAHYDLTGLTPETKYYFRIKGVSTTKTVYGLLKSFVTPEVL